jgi:hypothetical protein
MRSANRRSCAILPDTEESGSLFPSIIAAVTASREREQILTSWKLGNPKRQQVQSRKRRWDMPTSQPNSALETWIYAAI